MQKDHSVKQDLNRNHFYLLLGLSFLIPFILYLLTAPRTVTFEDSGLFILTASTLGIPHPPGYPLYTFVGYLFSFIPVGSVAFRIHLFSMICASAATAIFFLACLRVFKCQMISLSLALILATSKTLWSQAIVAEVYPLNVLFFSALFYLAIRFREEGSSKIFLWFSFVFGLSLSNHWPLIGLASPGLLLIILPQLRNNLKVIPKATGLALIGLTPYLFILLRSQFHLDYAFLGPITSISDLIAYIKRDFYSGSDIQKTATLKDSYLFIGNFLKIIFLQEWSFLVIPVFLVSLYKILKLETKLFVSGLLFVFLSSSVLLLFRLRFEFNELNENVFRVFYLLPIFVFTFSLGYGLKLLSERRVELKYFGFIFFILAIMLSWHDNNLKNDSLAEDYGRLLLEAVPQGYPFVAATDADVGPLAYVHGALGVNSEANLYTQSGVFFSDYIFPHTVRRKERRFQETVRFIRENERVYSTKSMDIFAGRENIPVAVKFNGLFYQLSSGYDEEPPLNLEMVERVKGILDRYIENSYSFNWGYHRGAVISRLCNFLILRGVEHPVFESSRHCRLIRARHHAAQKNYSNANDDYMAVMSKSSRMIRGERVGLYYNFLINQLEWVNNSPGDRDTKLGRVAEAARVAGEALFFHPHCDNTLIKTLNSLRNQVSLDPKISQSLDGFLHCDKSLRKKIRQRGSHEN